MIKIKIDWVRFPTTEYKQTKMVSYQEQLAKCQDTTEKYNTIWKNKEWTIKDYEDLFTDIERGYIIQGDFDTHHNYFIINPDFEEEEEREYTIEKQVVGMGYMSFYDEKDMLDQIVYCKNGCWKQKGDKTARDLDGGLCVTDDEEEEEEE